jgi:hypothetical protein
MRPFLTPKASSGNVQVLERTSDKEPKFGDSQLDDEGGEGDLSELEAAMQPLLKAFESKDHKAMARAFSDAFQIADMEPHEEYDHDENEESE